MNVGRLRHRATFQTLQTTENSYGEQVESWVDSFQIWTEITPINGEEFFQSNRTANEVNAKLLARFRSDIHDGMRVKHRGTVYDIEAVMDLFGRQVWLELYLRVVS